MRLSLMLLLLLPASIAVADIVTLKSGDRLVGQIVDRNEDAIFLQHPLFGTLKIDKTQIVPDASPTAAQSVATSAPTAPTPPRRWRFMKKLHDINFKLEAGFNGAEGNSPSRSGRIGVTANRETDARRWKFDAAYNRATNASVTTRNELTAGVTHDWLKHNSPWFYYARGRYDWDQFQAWDYRVNASGGAGYAFVDRDTLRLLGRAGLGGVKEWGSEDNVLHPEIEVGGEVKWKITDAQSLQASHMYFRALDDKQFRMRTTVQWVMKIDHADGVSLKLGMVNEYDSQPGNGKLENDLNYYGAMVFDF